MRERLINTIAAVLLSCAFLWALPAAASAANPFPLPCPGRTGFDCGALIVPLDRSGGAEGTISLSIERKLAGASPSRVALLALAGGPGQAALGFGEYSAKVMSSALGTRDLLVMDQRGTGTSAPLTCPAFEQFSSQPFAKVIEKCALQIGPARAGFTTAESVQDIEALRVAGGYEKLVLYGTSYGTKVALDYAEAYPQNVQALVLDSVVPAEGEEPYGISSFRALAPILDELCAARACAGITSDPVADLARLVDSMQRRAVHGFIINGKGRRESSTIDTDSLIGVLKSGDENPALRALLPAAVRSALSGDASPLLRLQALADGVTPDLPGGSGEESEEEGIDNALFWATSCEETPFPYSRQASSATRLAEARAAIDALPAGTFYPFDAAAAYTTSLIPECAAWPDAAPAPPAPAPLPDVPTLIFSGEQDMRTPTSNALQVAAQIPGAQVVRVAFTGHSVLGSDPSGCSVRAVAAFFDRRPIIPCTGEPDTMPPTAVPPRSVSSVRPAFGVRGLPGRTLAATVATVTDLFEEMSGAADESGLAIFGGGSFGGLRGGYATLTLAAVSLHSLSYVPGLRVSGTLRISGQLQGSGTLTIRGAGVASGSVRIDGRARRAIGTLGAVHFDVSIARAHAASAGAGVWPALVPRAAHRERALPARLR